MVRLFFYLIIISLLNNVKHSYEREKYLARTDFLTGLYNRRFFLELLSIELERCQRHNHPFTLAYIDLDNFKQVNDQFGHHRGDQLLKLIAETGLNNIRKIDIFARLGGDEFALLLLETDYKEANFLLLRLHQMLNETINLHSYPVGFSFGAITFTQFNFSANELIEQVDSLIYQVKNTGKNRLEHSQV
jgi:diguanylate cyclase (GGDEF)-like protein